MPAVAAPLIALTSEEIAEFCERNQIRKLSLFGSILTDRFRPESDIDVLVEFEPDKGPTMFGIIDMEIELTEKLGRKVDLRTAVELSRYFRDKVVANAVPQYERDVVRLRHMLDAGREAASFIQGRTSADLKRDGIFFLALVKEIEIIGEAANRISDETRSAVPGIPWPMVIGMRNRLIHVYEDINMDFVWSAVTQHIPALVHELERVLAGMD